MKDVKDVKDEKADKFHINANKEYITNENHARLAASEVKDRNLDKEDSQKIKDINSEEDNQKTTIDHDDVDRAKKVKSKKDRINKNLEKIKEIESWQKIKTRLLMDAVNKGLEVGDVTNLLDADINTIKSILLKKIEIQVTELLEHKIKINSDEINEKERKIDRSLIKLLQLRASIKYIGTKFLGPYEDPEKISDRDKQIISKEIDEEISKEFQKWGIDEKWAIAAARMEASHALWSISVLEKRLYGVGKMARTRKSIVKAEETLRRYIKEYKTDINNSQLNSKLYDSECISDFEYQYRVIQTYIYDCLKKENIEGILKASLIDRKYF